MDPGARAGSTTLVVGIDRYLDTGSARTDDSHLHGNMALAKFLAFPSMLSINFLSFSLHPCQHNKRRKYVMAEVILIFNFKSVYHAYEFS